jgi:ADP-ribose pyrophosphatase YjhB (NUDIX family)
MGGADGKRSSPLQARRAVDATHISSVHEYLRLRKARPVVPMSNWRLRLEPVITPFFRAWWRMRRPMTLGVRGLVCDESGRVLLVRHTYAEGWHLPGGGVDRGESARAAALRELAEEGGVEAQALSLIGFYSNHAHFRHDHIAFYRADTWRACAPHDNGEIAERGFFAMDALPKDVTPGTRRRLAEVHDGAPPSDIW